MKDNAPKKTLTFFTSLVLISFFLFFLDKRNILSPLKRILTAPFLVSSRTLYFSSLGIRRQFGFLNALKTREAEIQRLQTEVRLLSTEQNALSTCLAENEETKRLLGMPFPSSYKFLPVKVAGLTDKMKITGGGKEGVKEGMVVVSENILLGRVITVNDHDSLVQMVTDPDSRIPVVVKRVIGNNDLQGKGLLMGQGDALVLDKILQDEDVQKDDLVVTSGEDNWLPDLLIGKIEEVLPKTADVFRKARVGKLYNSELLDTVFVIIK
jgi:rod shape-determining protein MreC